MFRTFLALRYLKGRHKVWFKRSNLLPIAGIFLSVLSLLLVASVMNGFDRDMRRRVIGSKSEIKIHHSDYRPIDNVPQIIRRLSHLTDVKGAAPVSEVELLAQNKKHVTAVQCYGIDYDEQQKVNDVLSNIVVGTPDATMLEDDGILLGLDLSLTLNVTVGEYLRLSSPIGTEPTSFGLLPKGKTFKVVGIFISGLPDFDRSSVYISLDNTGYFIGMEGVAERIDVRTKSSSTSRYTAKELEELLGPDFTIEDWSQFDANLFNAIKLEKMVMYFVLILMMLIASFNMAGNFIKLVVEKREEIGILKAIGATDCDIKSIFLRIGLILGFLGVFSGEIIALVLLLLQ